MKKDARFWLFLGTFIYALIVFFLLREVVIPKLYNSPGGFIPGDPEYYNELAIEYAEILKRDGVWGWQLFYSGQGVVGLSALTFLVWDGPYLIMIINASLHAISAVMMFLILRQWFDCRIAYFAILPLVISPFMMLWFSQINKESLSLIGSLSFMYGLISVLNQGSDRSSNAKNYGFLFLFFGAFAFWLVRPYLNIILAPFFIIIVIIFYIRNFPDIRLFSLKHFNFIACSVLLISCMRFFSIGGASGETIKLLSDYKVATTAVLSAGESEVSRVCLEKLEYSNWRNSTWLPVYFNGAVKSLVGQRCLIFSLLQSNKNPVTESAFFDSDVSIGGVDDFLTYLPSGFFAGVFKPYPRDWNFVFGLHHSPFYAVALLEASLFYVVMLFLVVYVFRGGQWSIFIPVGIAMSVMTVYAVATPFFGALYRYRYPWWLIVFCIGIAALLSLANSHQTKVLQ